MHYNNPNLYGYNFYINIKPIIIKIIYIKSAITAFTIACCFLVPNSHLEDTIKKDINDSISIIFIIKNTIKLAPYFILLNDIIKNAIIGKSQRIEILIILCIKIYLFIYDSYYTR